MKLSFENIFFIVFLLFTSFGKLFSQQDTSRAQWFRNYYSSKYLEDVLNKKEFNYRPPDGIVPDSSTAIIIAETILSRIYGAEQISKEKPFTAILSKDYWIVYGNIPDGFKGGVAEIVIRKSDGQIINIAHGK
jgi:hypothetical protein